MHEHLIRLRGGWEFLGTEGAIPRVSLPLVEIPDGPRLLLRRFQAPRFDSFGESLWLRLARVPGLVSVVLNGREIARGPFEAPKLLLPLAELVPGGNQLILDVAFSGGQERSTDGFSWGEIGLVVRSEDTS